MTHEVDSGRYSSSQEVVEAPLRLLEDRDVRLEALRMAIDRGDRSGFASPFDKGAFLIRMREEHLSG